MTSAFVDRIVLMVALSVPMAVIALDFGTTLRIPEARATTDWHLNKEIARERVTCERWGMQEGSEKYVACLADLTGVRVKHDRRRADGAGNRRDGLITIF